MKRHEVIIIGGGPAGSTLLSYLAKAGVDAAVIEREVFPRFHIGESLLPYSMDIFRETGVFEKLDNGKYLRKFGAQFVHHEEEGEVYFDFASGLDDKHPMAFEVPREQFDKDLMDHARALGGTVYQPEMVKDVQLGEAGARIVTNRGEYGAAYVIDASGRSAFFGKKYKIRHPNLDMNNVGVFAHYLGVERPTGKREGDITIGLLPGLRWCWLIPFAGERMSVGVVCSSESLRQGALDDYIETSLAAGPELSRRMKSAERVTEIGMISNYSHTCETMVGDRWMLIGDAAAFLDPIFSSGVHVGITSAKFAAEAIVEVLAKGGAPLTADGVKERYEAKLRLGVERFHRLIRLFYDTNFVRQMKKTFERKNVRMAFTSMVAGGAWDQSNFLFEKGLL